MIDSAQLRQRAQRRFRELRAVRRDPRFVRTLGKLVAAELLTVSYQGVEPYTRRVRLAEVLWAGEHEPRVLELLPAIVVKLPKLFVLPTKLPDDLDAVVRAIRRGREHPSFRGVEPRAYLPWVERIGTRGKVPTTLRTFRLRPDDQARLARLKERLPAPSETEVIRIVLRLLDQQLQ